MRCNNDKAHLQGIVGYSLPDLLCEKRARWRSGYESCSQSYLGLLGLDNKKREISAGELLIIAIFLPYFIIFQCQKWVLREILLWIDLAKGKSSLFDEFQQSSQSISILYWVEISLVCDRFFLLYTIINIFESSLWMCSLSETGDSCYFEKLRSWSKYSV